MTKTEIAFHILGGFSRGVQGDPKYQLLMKILNEVDTKTLNKIVGEKEKE